MNTIVLMAVNGKYVTHRVVGYDQSGAVITKGDANAVEDHFAPETVRIARIYRFRLPGFGYPLLYLSNLRCIYGAELPRSSKSSDTGYIKKICKLLAGSYTHEKNNL